MKRTAIVTGASKGIGKAIAEELAENGWHLALFGFKNKESLMALSSELKKKYKIEVFTYIGDIKDYVFVTESCKDAIEKLGHIDVLVNNAGIAHTGLLSDMEINQWNDIIATNLSSLFFTAKAVVPSMVSRKSGNIINISSMWGVAGASCEVAYSASKGGVNSFTKALAKELSPSNIAVNAIACGVVDTDMNSHLSDEEKSSLADDIPAGRFASCTEIAKAVIGIINMPGYMTGQVIGIDGGYI